MKVLVIFSLLMVALLARSTKNYLIELEDKNETINEKEINNNDEGMDAEPGKVLTLDSYMFVNTEPKSL